MREKNKEITYIGDELINILKEIEYILISLHQMGSYFYEKDAELYEKETTKFIDNSDVCSRLASIRKILSRKFDDELGDDEMDDIERACQDIPYWTKPGDYTKQKWLDVKANNE
ncbi:MAG: hypothetical protein II838_01515 [Lachnospiraceae bacterium]|nr:hypothetical protein [Lachnospiraceae bacterium]